MISIHALREEGDPAPPPSPARSWYFYPRPPRGGRHFVDTNKMYAIHISIHALREEGDSARTGYTLTRPLFLSTPSARRATEQTLKIGYLLTISIHALREEGDRFSPSILITIDVFLSTPSARRATIYDTSTEVGRLYFYPRPPRGGRHNHLNKSSRPLEISIHALREEGDITHTGFSIAIRYFYPRPPRGGRHKNTVFEDVPTGISIHALREEGDDEPVKLKNFWGIFLSTPSARRATQKQWQNNGGKKYFYPRPPRGGRLHHRSPLHPSPTNFYPRPPRGGRLRER